MLLQKELSIIRKPEGYYLMINGDPVHVNNTASAYDFAVVNINPSDFAVHMELYRNQDSVPETDLNDPNTFLIPIQTN